MPTAIKLLMQLSGLSIREAAAYLDVPLDTVKSWSCGRNGTPERIIERLRDLVDEIDRAAGEVLYMLEEIDIADESSRDQIPLDYCSTDAEAQARGLPCVGAHNAVLARVIAATDKRWVLASCPSKEDANNGSDISQS